MWSVWVDGAERRLADVPLSDVLELERRCQTKLETFDPRRVARHAAELCLLLGVDPSQVDMSDIRPSDPDLPAYWTDGKPAGGRTLDGWIVAMCKPPFSFTPHQVRTEFTLRDLELIVSAS